MTAPSENLEEELRHRYLLSGIATGPASPEAIDKVEKHFGIHLPAAYRAYLRVCGENPPPSLAGSDCTLRQLPDINTWAKELIAENSVNSISPDAFFAFLVHQGYTFLYFPLDSEDDPPVYCYLEGESEAKQVAERFSHWAGEL